MDKLDECFEKGLLKKIMKQPDLARKDLRQARFFLQEANELLRLDKKAMATLALYNAFFHAARALLFKDGVKERNHYCLARYVEKYVTQKKIPSSLLDAFETVMNLRHTIQYSTEEIKIEEDLSPYATLCEQFISAVERLLIG